jgi:calmodulin
LRTLGQNPTEDELAEMVFEAGCKWEGFLARENFVDAGIWALTRQANRIDDVKAAFRIFDHNNDGSISMEELRDAMVRYGQSFTEEECEEMFSTADRNGDGNIDFDEFLSMMTADAEEVNYTSAGLGGP